MYNRRKRGGFETGNSSFLDRNISAITLTLVALVSDSTLPGPDDEFYSLQVPVMLLGGGMCSGGCLAPQCGTRGLG